MAKDPAFLFYSKDWIEGTAEMTSQEKGVYIDLLAHQHQKGDLPKDINRLCKLSGLSVDEFTPIWEHLKHKFKLNSVDRLVNRKLTELTTERSEKGKKNKIISVLGIVVRKCNRSQKDKEIAKSNFRLEDFAGIEEPKLTETITEWFYKRLPPLEDANANGNINLLKGFNTKPLASDFNGLPEIKIGSVIELFKITKNTTVSESQVKGLWNIFKIQNLTGEKYYQSESDVHSHFINWSKTQRIDKLDSDIKAQEKSVKITLK